MEFLADIDFVECVWTESLEGIEGHARAFAQSHSRSTFAISVPTSIRFLASTGADAEETVERFLKAFPVIDFDQRIIGRAAALFRAHDIPLETAVEGAIAREHGLKILTGTPVRYSSLPGVPVIGFHGD